MLIYADSPQVKTFAIRVVVLTWAIFGLVLSAFYTANLTAYVTVPMYGFPVERLEDLRTNTEVKWLARSGTFLTATIEDHNATDDVSYPYTVIMMVTSEMTTVSSIWYYSPVTHNYSPR